MTEVEKKTTATDSQNRTSSQILLIAVLEFIPKLFWPTIAVVVLIMFESPIYEAVTAVSGQIANGGASIEISGLKVTLSKDEIPPPPDDVKEVLPQLDAKLIEFIVANVGGKNTLDICYRDRNPEEFMEESVSNRLRKLDLITFEKEQWHESDGTPCSIGSKTKYTPLYDAVRKYLIDVLKSITFMKQA